MPGIVSGGKWGDIIEELNADEKIGGGGIKLAENPVEDTTENGKDVGDIRGEAVNIQNRTRL